MRNQQYTTQASIIRPERFGVDIVIHPEKAACQEIIRLVKHPYAVQVMDFESGRLTMLGLKIDSDCENIYDKPLGKIALLTAPLKFGSPKKRMEIFALASLRLLTPLQKAVKMVPIFLKSEPSTAELR